MEIRLKSENIASFLGAEITGSNFTISSFRSISNLKPFSLSFTKAKQLYSDFPITVIATHELVNSCSNITKISVNDPKLSFSKILDEFYPFESFNITKFHNVISKNANIGKNVSIGNYTSIMDDVSIGEDTFIGNNVSIYCGTKIGSNCVIQSNTVIGHPGFGFVFENSIPYRFKHIGYTFIGNNVEIGCNCTIARASLDTTVISDNVKIDDHVHIAHNCEVGSNTIITAGAVISGSVKVEPNCWIGPNSSIIQKKTIGNNSLVGIGSIISKSIPSNSKYMSLTSFTLRNLAKVNKFLKRNI